MHPCFASVYHSSAYYGGNEHYLDHLAKAIQRLKIPVHYLTGFAKQNNIPYPLTHIPTLSVFNKPFPTWSWHSPLPENCDIFHASGSGLPLIFKAAFLKRRFPHIPRILTYQADSIPQNKLMRILVKCEQWAIARYFPYIITTSPLYQQELKKRWPANHIHFIPLFLSPVFNKLASHSSIIQNRLHPQKSTKAILFVGQMDQHHYYKDVPTLIQAVSLLPKEYHCYLVGGGELLSEYVCLSQSLSVASRCHFLGKISHNRLPPYFHHADVFVLPSSTASEGFGMVCLEAMSQKTPVITTSAVGASGYFNKHRVATIIEPSNASALAQAIQKQIIDRDENKVKRAFHFAKEHSLQSMATKTVALYKELYTQSKLG